MTAATATQATTTLRTGAVVQYNGSQTDFRGILFKVSYAGDLYGTGGRRYSLTYYGDDAAHPRVILSNVRRESVTYIPARQVKTRTCSDRRNCGISYYQVAELGINPDGCPMCALCASPAL
jgi:hypothetical protein